MRVLCSCGGEFVPKAILHGCQLQAVRVAYLVGPERFCSAFELPGIEYFRLQFQLVQRALEERHYGGKAFQLYAAGRVKVNTVGSRGNVVGTLRDIFAISINKLARCAECRYVGPQLL